jgi:hypothetical protein
MNKKHDTQVRLEEVFEHINLSFCKGPLMDKGDGRPQGPYWWIEGT